VAIRASLVASVVVAAVVATAAGACGTPKSDFVCGADPECTLGAIQGQCQADGYCSFPDPGCISGQRYGEYGPDGVAGTCVQDLQAADASPGGADARAADAAVADADLGTQAIDAHAAAAHASTPDAAKRPDAAPHAPVMCVGSAIDAWYD
jgi:hypothetical protein